MLNDKVEDTKTDADVILPPTLTFFWQQQLIYSS